MGDNTEYKNVTVYESIESRQSRFSFIWLLPLIAFIIGGWLIYKNFIEEDLLIRIHFESGAGIVEGKTKLKHKGVHIGMVQAFQIDDDLKGVTATVIVNRNAEAALKENTKFWLVEPRVSIQGISGLDTLVAGSYISMIPGNGKPCYDFQAMKEPPPLPLDEPGLHLRLQTEDLGSIHQGAPIHFKKMIVGDVQSYTINSDTNGIDIRIHIKKEYQHLVRENARFWNCSGISVTGDLVGLTVKAESLASILSGGVAFYHPENEAEPSQASNGDTFRLYDDYKTADAGIPVTIAFDSAEGLVAGKTKVLYRGVEAGILNKITLNKNFDGILGEFDFVPKSGRALNETTRFWVVKPRFSLTEISGLDTIISGNYIEMSFKKGLKSKRTFIILDEPPPVENDTPGLRLTLKSLELGSISRGTEIYYRKIPVGMVLDYQLAKNDQSIDIKVLIEKPYAHLVNASSRFWNTSGIQVKGDFGGIDIRTESLESIIYGGMAFYTPDSGATKVRDNHLFDLYNDYESASETGIPITIYFKNGDGLKVDTVIKYRGINVGIVKQVSTDKDLSKVVVKAVLNTVAEKLAIEGTKFWVVRPRLGLIQAANLETLVSGQYIEAIPGTGKVTDVFTGLEKPPVISTHVEGLDLVLTAPTLGSLKEGAGVYYREVPVGSVSGYRLSKSSNKVLIYINIDKEYASLVHKYSRFWNVSGLGIDFSFFKGAKVRMESVESLLAGGVAFATPNNRKGSPATPHMEFKLYDKPKDSWLKWVPVIDLDVPE